MTCLIAELCIAVVSSVPHHDRDQPPPMQSAIASWYDQQGVGACNLPGGAQAGMRFASLILRCGTRVRFCYRHRCVTATMADHGPYVPGRTFDLNVNLRGALGCSGICPVRWRLA
jgi:hypothetical protein